MSGCAVDWVATGQMLNGIGAILGAFAVFYAARYWITQRKKEIEIQTATEFSAAMYHVQHAIEHVRSGNRWTDEDENAKKELDKLGFDIEEGKRKYAIRLASALVV